MQKKTCQAYRPPPHVLSELIVEKGYEKVTVQDVIDRANVGIVPDLLQLLKVREGAMRALAVKGFNATLRSRP